jgi:hypothetical protein
VQPIEDAASAVDDNMVQLFETAAFEAKVDWWPRYRSIYPGRP